MSLDDAKRVLKGASLTGKTVLDISGGEPFLYYQEVLELVAYARRLGFEVVIDTNGFWGSTIGNAKEKLRELAAAGLKKISDLSSEDDWWSRRYVHR